MSAVCTWVRRFVSLGCIALSSTVMFAQGSKMISPYDPIREEDTDHPIQREQWFARGRTIPGQAAAALRYRAHLQKMQMRAAQQALFRARNSAAAGPLAGPGGIWVPLGPAPLASDASGNGTQDYNWVSGRATSVVIDPADSTGNTVFVGGAYGGVWKSTNAGPLSVSPGNVTWTPVLDNQATLAVGAIAIQPGNGNTANSVVLVGTGEANSSADSYYGIGILRSTNGGSTWTTITQSADSPARPFAGMAVSKIAYSTANASLAVAAFAGSALGDITNLENPTTVNRGLYYSQDGGASWHYATVTDSGVPVAPGSATSVMYNAGAGLFFAALRFHGIYSSSDGIHWSRLATQPSSALTLAACPTNPSSSACPIYRGEFTSVSGRNEMYVWFVDSGENDMGIWRTTNSGSSWGTQLSETGITACGDTAGCGTSQGTYNLELNAVVNGSATDLYAGAINLYKCTLNTTSSTTCSQGSWLNLTHVYGCSSIAKVHPDQHDVDSIVSNGKALLYFANDGGIYRTLDGFLGLTTTSCSGTNQFDSLNQTLGSMTQFVSFSQHPSDPNTLLGGTQDNGSPATGSSQSNSSWLNVNAGDGGFNEINPSNTTEWFSANTDVTIQRCTSGISCLSQLFPYVVQSSNLSGDHGEFYTPYILDPASATSELIIGTCRVWRGPGTGGVNTALSGDFEPGGSLPCSGTETNLVRTLAAGGAKDSSGFSKVIYAGTDGFGPITTLAPGGHVWVTTNAAGGPSTWADRTGTINLNTFPIASVAIDSSDTTGNTAYVGIMGFHVSHVWKTTNAGVAWSDFSGSGAGLLPDAPVNALLVDPAGTVYAGTDVGVFSSNTASPNWTEVGPAPNSGLIGFLPNVAVTALRLFNSGGSKKVRASTYGRGIWEFNLITNPDFQIAVPAPSQTIFPTQSATYNGTITAFNGYSSQVSLSCTGTVPSTCTLNPTQLTPTPTGVSFSTTASGAIGDYSFNVHGVGSDVNTVTHDFPLTLHVVDFGIGSFSSTALNANEPNSSNAITFQVTGSGSFGGAVTLSCGGLPTGASCNFTPSSTVNPTSSTPVTVTLIVGTTTSTPTGVSPITLMANTSGAPAAKTQALTLTVTANPDYTLILASSSGSAAAGSTANLTGTITAYNGYTSSVNLSCAAGPPTCTVAPTSVVPSTSGTMFTATLGSSAVQNYNFSVSGQGTDPLAIVHTASGTFDSTFDFTMTAQTTTQSVKAGAAAAYMLNLAPTGSGNTFPTNVAFTCTGLPLRSACAFTTINTGSGAATATLTISTTAPSAALQPGTRTLFYAMLLPFPGLVFAFGGLRRRRLRGSRIALLTLTTLLLGFLVACGGGSSSGGGGQPGTPTGTYTITVTATSGSAPTKTVPLTLTVQ